MSTIIDLIICGVIAGLCYALMSEGLWGAALMFFNVVFSSLIALNFYEPLATLIDSTGIPWGFSDTLSLLGIFCVSVGFLRMTTETIAPAMMRFPTPIYHLGRFIFGAGAAIVTVAFILVAYHTAPVHKKIFSAVDYNSKPPFGMGLDHQCLGFFQYETGAVFTTFDAGGPDPFGTYGVRNGVKSPVNVFDPRAKWLIEHQEARPYGDEKVLSDEPAAAAPSSGQPPATPVKKGAAAPVTKGAPARSGGVAKFKNQARAKVPGKAQVKAPPP